jgi:cytochrome P450
VSESRGCKTPPGPAGSGSSNGARNPLEYLTGLVRDYGDTVLYRNPYGPVYFFNHPEQVHAILQNSNLVRTPLVTIMMGDGLLASDGPYWREQRKLVQPAFHERCLQGYAPLISEYAIAMAERWERLAAIGEPVDISSDIKHLALSIILKVMFSVSLSAGDLAKLCDAITTAINDLGAVAWTFFNVPSQFKPSRSAQFREAKAMFDQIVHRIIADRRLSTEKPRDLLSVLLQAQDATTGQPLTDNQIRDEIATMIIGGHETTALTLSWAWHLLAQHPLAEQRLEAEVDDVLQGRTPTTADLPALSYTRMVLQETLRLYPPVWFMMRKAVVADQIGDYEIPANSMVLISPYTTQRHPDHWKDPDQFVPERFLPEHQTGRHRGAFVAFAGGRHHCLGHAFAMMEGQTVLAILAQRFRFRPEAGHQVELDPVMSLRQRDGVRGRIQIRSNFARPQAAE